MRTAHSEASQRSQGRAQSSGWLGKLFLSPGKTGSLVLATVCTAIYKDQNIRDFICKTASKVRGNNIQYSGYRKFYIYERKEKFVQLCSENENT